MHALDPTPGIPVLQSAARAQHVADDVAPELAMRVLTVALLAAGCPHHLHACPNGACIPDYSVCCGLDNTAGCAKGYACCVTADQAHGICCPHDLRRMASRHAAIRTADLQTSGCQGGAGTRRTAPRP